MFLFLSMEIFYTNAEQTLKDNKNMEKKSTTNKGRQILKDYCLNRFSMRCIIVQKQKLNEWKSFYWATSNFKAALLTFFGGKLEIKESITLCVKKEWTPLPGRRMENADWS